MARPIDYDLRDRMLNFFKEESIRQGGKFDMSLSDVAVRVGEKAQALDKMSRMVQMLERGGHIRVTKGKGATANTYEYMNEAVPQKAKEIREKIELDLVEYRNRVDNLNKDLFNYIVSLQNQLSEAYGKLEYYKGAILGLDEAGVIDGRRIFRDKNGTIESVITELKAEGHEGEEEQEEE